MKSRYLAAISLLACCCSAAWAEPETETSETAQEPTESARTNAAETPADLNSLLEDATLDEETRAALLALRREKTRLQLENELQVQKNSRELAKLNAENERLKLEAEILQQKQQLLLATLENEKSKLTLENDLTEQELRKKKLELELKIAAPKYLHEPFIEDTLYISDRRITLDGPIWPGTADYVTQRIHYFNNRDHEYPIFLVIDISPGGSVVEGARILEAMRNSKAPVYVVVKSAAASMAAILTALAERSFAYPNAMLVHHQISMGYFGNPTQISERMKITNEWSTRMAEPVAKKMGLNLDEFVVKMYEHNKDGNWIEFATEAQKLGWVDHIVTSIRETSYVEMPEDVEKEQEVNLEIALHPLAKLVTDEQGVQRLRLPRLLPGDLYHLYNPDGYYLQW